MFDDDYIGKIVCGIKDYNKYDEHTNEDYWDWLKEMRQLEALEEAHKSIKKTFQQHLDYEMEKHRQKLKEIFK